MTAPTSFLDGLRDFTKPARCKAGEAFDKHLTAEEVTEFVNVGKSAVAGESNLTLAALRRFFNEHTGEQVGKDVFSRHMRGECHCG